MTESIAIPLEIERVFLPSAIRRGRLATSPTFFVQTPMYRYRFTRKVDAQRFINFGGICLHHQDSCIRCPGCFGYRTPVDSKGKGET